MHGPWGIRAGAAPTQLLQDRRVRRHEKLFGISDMHPDVRPRDIYRRTVEARAMMQEAERPKVKSKRLSKHARTLSAG
jgi:hypothetical protein